MRMNSLGFPGVLSSKLLSLALRRHIMHLSKPMGRVASSLRGFREKISYQDILGILLGSFVLALSIQVIMVPAHILTGGVTGIAIILKFLVGVDIWVWYIGCLLYTSDAADE